MWVRSTGGGGGGGVMKSNFLHAHAFFFAESKLWTWYWEPDSGTTS
jgi:hypothetical protein